MPHNGNLYYNVYDNDREVAIVDISMVDRVVDTIRVIHLVELAQEDKAIRSATIIRELVTSWSEHGPVCCK